MNCCYKLVDIYYGNLPGQTAGGSTVYDSLPPRGRGSVRDMKYFCCRLSTHFQYLFKRQIFDDLDKVVI
jgi:hypothetical protein